MKERDIKIFNKEQEEYDKKLDEHNRQAREDGGFLLVGSGICRLPIKDLHGTPENTDSNRVGGTEDNS